MYFALRENYPKSEGKLHHSPPRASLLASAGAPGALERQRQGWHRRARMARRCASPNSLASSPDRTCTQTGSPCSPYARPLNPVVAASHAWTSQVETPGELGSGAGQGNGATSARRARLERGALQHVCHCGTCSQSLPLCTTGLAAREYGMSIRPSGFSIMRPALVATCPAM